MPLIGHMAFHFIHSHRFLSVSLCLVYTKTERRTLFSCLITMHLHGSSRLDRRTKLMLYLYTSNTVEKKMTIPNLKIAPTNNSFWVVLCVSLCGCLYRRCCRRRLITKPMFDQIPKSEQCVRLIDKRCCICLIHFYCWMHYISFDFDVHENTRYDIVKFQFFSVWMLQCQW